MVGELNKTGGKLENENFAKNTKYKIVGGKVYEAVPLTEHQFVGKRSPERVPSGSPKRDQTTPIENITLDKTE